MPADPGDDLIERTVLRAVLRERLLAGDVALHGLGGIGKSTLARQVAEDLRGRFPGGVLWAAIGQEATGPALAAVLADLVTHLTGEPPGVVTADRAGERLAAELAVRPPVLLVVDDVWTAEQLAPFLQADCRRLITTRVGAVLPGDVHRIDVGEMTHDEATALLTRDLPGIALPDLSALLAMTGRWPLLTALANGVLRGGTPAHQLIDQIGAGGWVALDLTVPGERERAVEGLVTAALDGLSEADRRCLTELAIFPDGGPIPDRIIDSLWSGTCGRSPADSDSSRTALAALNVVRRSPAGVWMSGVLRTYLRNRLPDQEIAQVNRRLVEMSRPRSGGPWWTLPHTDRYLWRHLAFHLREARWWDELFAVVTDLRRLAVQIPMFGVAAAVADLALMPDPRATALRARLSRSAHLLHPIRPAEALTDVLLSRLSGAPELAADVASLAAAQRPRAGLTARRPLPDVGPDSLTRVIPGDGDWLDAVAISPRSDWIAVAGDSGVITLHDWAEGGVLTRFAGHTGAVKALAATFDGEFLLSAGGDGTLRLWDVARSQERTVWTVPGEILDCAAAPGNHRIAAVSGLGELVVLDVAGNWRILEHRAGVKLVGCAFLGDDRVLTVTEEGRVVGHDLRSGRRKSLVEAGKAGMLGFAVDSTWVAVSGIHGDIRVHPLRGDGEVVTLSGHQGCVDALAAFGDRIVSGGEDGTVRVFDRYGEQVAVVRAHPGWVTGCVIAPDRRTLVTTGSDGSVRVWDLARLAQETVGGPVDWVNTCTVSPSSSSAPSLPGVLSASVVTGGQDGVVRLWHETSSTPIWSWDDPVRRCAFSPDGTWLVAVCATGTALLRNVGDSWVDTVHPGAEDCAVSVDLFARWNATGELEIRSVTGPDVYRRTHDQPIRAATFLPRRRMLIADATGTLSVWHYAKDRIRSLPLPPTPEIQAIHQTADKLAVISATAITLFDVRGLRTLATTTLPAEQAPRSAQGEGPSPSPGGEGMSRGAGGEGMSRSPGGEGMSRGAGGEGLSRSPGGEGMSRSVRDGKAPYSARGAGVPHGVRGDGMTRSEGTARGVRGAWATDGPQGARVPHGAPAKGVTHGAISPDGQWLATTSTAGELHIWPMSSTTPDWQPAAAMRVDGALFECAWVPESLDLYAAGQRGLYAFNFRPPRTPTPG